MSSILEIKSLLLKRKADIKEQASNGSLGAIAALTGVSRQTLYRWKKGGMTITEATVQNRICNPSTGLNEEKPRGRRLKSAKPNAYLPGLTRADNLKARKQLDVAILDLAEAVALCEAGKISETDPGIIMALSALKRAVPLSIWNSVTELQ